MTESSSYSSQSSEAHSSDKCYTPKTKYEKLLFAVYTDKRISRFLAVISHVIVILSIISYFIALLLQVIRGKYIFAITLISFSAIPFFAVTIFRKWINSPRPYQLIEFYEAPPKKKAGESFPSRHVFSSFIIGTLYLSLCLPGGIILLTMGLILGISRVLLGIHFIRDVVSGALIGLIAGGLSLLFLNIFPMLMT